MQTFSGMFAIKIGQTKVHDETDNKTRDFNGFYFSTLLRNKKYFSLRFMRITFAFKNVNNFKTKLTWHKWPQKSFVFGCWTTFSVEMCEWSNENIPTDPNSQRGMMTFYK